MASAEWRSRFTFLVLLATLLKQTRMLFCHKGRFWAHVPLSVYRETHAIPDGHADVQHLVSKGSWGYSSLGEGLCLSWISNGSSLSSPPACLDSILKVCTSLWGVSTPPFCVVIELVEEEFAPSSKSLKSKQNNTGAGATLGGHHYLQSSS